MFNDEVNNTLKVSGDIDEVQSFLSDIQNVNHKTMDTFLIDFNVHAPVENTDSVESANRWGTRHSVERDNGGDGEWLLDPSEDDENIIATLNFFSETTAPTEWLQTVGEEIPQLRFDLHYETGEISGQVVMDKGELVFSEENETITVDTEEDNPENDWDSWGQ